MDVDLATGPIIVVAGCHFSFSSRHGVIGPIPADRRLALDPFPAAREGKNIGVPQEAVFPAAAVPAVAVLDGPAVFPVEAVAAADKIMK